MFGIIVTAYQIVNKQTFFEMDETATYTSFIVFLGLSCIFYFVFIISLWRVYNSLKVSNQLKADELYMAMQFLMILVVFVTFLFVIIGNQTTTEYLTMSIGIFSANLLMAIIMSFTIFKGKNKIGITKKYHKKLTALEVERSDFQYVRDTENFKSNLLSSDSQAKSRLSAVSVIDRTQTNQTN
jgi:membrane-associated HD superfamily phosphohydrolase